MSIVNKIYKEIVEADLNDVYYYTVVAHGARDVRTSSHSGVLVVRFGGDVLRFSRDLKSPCHLETTHRKLNRRLMHSEEFMEFFSSTIRILSL